MKKFLPFMSLVLVTAAACNTTPEKAVKSSPVEPSAITSAAADTAGMAEFREWKASNELMNVQAYQAGQPVVAARPAVRKSVAAPVRKSTASAPVKSKPASNQSTPSSDNSTASDNGGGGTGTTDAGAGEVAKAEKKEGWSKAAKGAVIGGVAGAAGGAVLNKKNRVLGAVIGGVVGAAGGYGIGRTMDKKDGRIEINPQ
jgi:hypothetical protein